MGADYLLENGTLYKYVGPGWRWQAQGVASFSAQAGKADWTIARAAIDQAGCGARATLLVQVQDNAGHIVSGTAFPDPGPGTCPAGPTAANQIQYVFVIALENEPAGAIYGSADAPYLSGQILPSYARAAAFVDPLADDLPSEPHYVWMEAGTNTFADTTFTTDADPSAANSTASTAHLVTQMQAASPPVSWLGFQEGLGPSTTGACPILSTGFYAAKHDPFVFFQDVTGSPPSAGNAFCAAHHRAYKSATFPQVLAGGAVARYNFITPNLCDDMHGAGGCPDADDIQAGDQWLAANLPPLIQFAEANAGVIFIVWDEPEGGSNLIPFFAVGAHVRPGYASSVSFNHGSLTRSVERIFGLPILPAVAQVDDFTDLFEPGFFP